MCWYLIWLHVCHSSQNHRCSLDWCEQYDFVRWRTTEYCKWSIVRSVLMMLSFICQFKQRTQLIMMEYGNDAKMIQLYTSFPPLWIQLLCIKINCLVIIWSLFLLRFVQSLCRHWYDFSNMKAIWKLYYLKLIFVSFSISPFLPFPIFFAHTFFIEKFNNLSFPGFLPEI